MSTACRYRGAVKDDSVQSETGARGAAGGGWGGEGVG